MNNTKIAIVHEWLINFAGSEKVVEQILQIYPEADLHALLEYLNSDRKKSIQFKKVKTSFLQYLPLSKRYYRYYLPLMPIAIKSMNAPNADIIISSSHAVSKGFSKTKKQLHICYCHTPMRYAWDLHDVYLQSAGLNKGFRSYFVKAILSYMRKWDFQSAKNVDYFVANSSYVAERIRNIYKRDAYVIHPPVDVNFFTLHLAKENYYVTAARMVPYKKVDIIIDAFSRLPDKKLVVIGDGPELSRLKEKAISNVEILGYQSSEMLKYHLQRAKAFIFAADEDFGITSIEAQACGTPVLAYRKGGNLETVVENKTGLFFDEQSTNSLIECILNFEKKQHLFDPVTIRAHAENFGEERFKIEFKKFVEKKYSEFLNSSSL